MMADPTEPEWSQLDAAEEAESVWQKIKRLSGETQYHSSWRKVIELVVFALLVPILGSILFAHDPVGLDTGFAWVSVLPVIFSARYGAAWGLACAALASLTLVLLGVYTGRSTELITLAAGTVVLAVVIGDAAGGWRKKNRQVDAENEYLRHRLKEFSNDYHVLKVSHGQLEEYMAGQRLSLRYALQQLKPVLNSNPDGLEAGSELMAIFAQFCSIQVAGLYAMKSPTSIDPTPVAIHGEMDDLPLFDQLLKLALKERQLVSVKLDAMTTDQHDAGLLAVVPIVDSQGRLYGMLAVRDMHFMAFQQENLNILSLLGHYVGDMLARSEGFGDSQATRFLAELDTAVRYARSHSVHSSLLCIDIVPGAQSAVVAELISTNIRSLDSSWIPQSSMLHTTVVILLPLVSQNSCAAYANRVATLVEDELKLNASQWLKDVRSLQINESGTRKRCFELINRSTGVGTVDNYTQSDDDEDQQIIA